LAAEIRKTFGVESEIVRGSGGIFIVSADNQTLFSKKEQGRFPTEREIIEMLRSLGL
jgi:selT/selW/selH-like putative selenoprotein